MDLETLGNLGEFVSGVVVIISLVYLASQVRQNTESLRTENYSRALERIASMQARAATDPAYSNLISKGAASSRNLTAAERNQFVWIFYEMFGALEFMFHQAQRGAIPEEIWKNWSDTLSFWIALPGVQAWWKSRPTPFTESFVAHVEARMEAGSYDPHATERWVRFIQGDDPS